MKYLRSADLGFDKDQQVIVPLRSGKAKNMYTSFKNELLKKAGIANVGASLYYPGVSNLSDNLFFKDGENMQQARDVKDELYRYTLFANAEYKACCRKVVFG